MEKLPQALRERLVVIFKEVIAINKVDIGEDLTFNRLSGAVYHKLLQPTHTKLSEDDAVNLAINLTSKGHLLNLLQEYDEVVGRRNQQAKKQVCGIVNNLIQEYVPNRQQVIQDTLDMLERFPLERSITRIRKLVQARVANGHVDIDEYDYQG